jgi:asparagine synthase (glutamine-hydrolysing)
MCGIAGFIDFKQNTTEQTLTQMTDVLEHRGPDDKGYKVWETQNATIGFGHRRLSIIDLSPLGHQPMYSSDGRWAIVFNGEIYNYKEIQTELKDLGYTFKSNSDTEVIIYAVDCWGLAAVHKFIGMFAFALYDSRDNKVHLVRDRAGVKPLYYYWKDGLFMFGSELKAFHQHPRFEKTIDTDAVGLYFYYLYIPAPYSIFKDTFKLTQGHFLTLSLENGNISTEKYWDVYDYYAKPALKISKEDAIEETTRIIKSACEYRMVADVPVGIFLSGGYDSGLTTALLQQNRTKKLKTFTIGYGENAYFTETKEAKQVANHLGTDHTEYIVKTEEAFDILDNVAFYYDEPLGDGSSVPTTLVSRLARKHVTVALSADGGDETFAGYTRYEYLAKQQAYFKYIPKFAAKATASILSQFDPKNIPLLNRAYNINSRYEKVVNLLNNSSLDNAYKLFLAYFSEKDVRQLLKNPFTFHETVVDKLPPNGHGNDPIQAMLAMEYKSYMVDIILAKVDRATMSASLEGREPLLDHRIVEFAAQLPSTFKYDNGVKKVLLREIVHKRIPPELMVKRKMGFGAPIHSWLSQPRGREFARAFLDIKKIEAQGILNPKAVEPIIKAYFDDKTPDYNKVWLLLVFQMWYERWMN